MGDSRHVQETGVQTLIGQAVFYSALMLLSWLVFFDARGGWWVGLAIVAVVTFGASLLYNKTEHWLDDSDLVHERINRHYGSIALNDVETVEVSRPVRGAAMLLLLDKRGEGVMIYLDGTTEFRHLLGERLAARGHLPRMSKDALKQLGLP